MISSSHDINHLAADVIVVGAGLTGLTTAFRISLAGKKVLVIDRDSRPGGQINTLADGTFIYESGPNTGVVSNPEVAELFEDLNPQCRLETAREASKRRLIWKGNRFRPLPSGPLSAITTPLFSITDKFRILGEPWRKPGNNPDESVASLARRRLGKSFVNYAVDPFLSGVYAGNPDRLVTRYALPKLYNLEQQYGSFIKGSIAKARQPKTERDLKATRKVFSAYGGLGNLVNALVRAIGSDNIMLNAGSLTINPRSDSNWDVHFTTPQGGFAVRTPKVITTVGSYSLPAMLPFLPSEQSSRLDNLTYAPIVQVSVGYRDTGGISYPAFGGLVPSVEHRDVLGILFPSSCFENRAPHQGGLFSFFIGGIRHPEMLSMSDDQLQSLVCREMHSMLKFPAGKEPDLISIARHLRAIPQYEANSKDRFDAIDEIERTYPGLIIGGNLKGGIGMADRIRQGTNLASRV